jgi:heme/copper-type cytochrome/quinol oxidase subunit 4
VVAPAIGGERKAVRRSGLGRADIKGRLLLSFALSVILSFVCFAFLISFSVSSSFHLVDAWYTHLHQLSLH